MAEALRLAQRLGGESGTLPGQDVAETIIDYARANNVTHMIVGKPPRGMVAGTVPARSPSG